MVPKVVSNIENAIRFDGFLVIGQNIEAFLSLAAQYPTHLRQIMWRCFLDIQLFNLFVTEKKS